MPCSLRYATADRCYLRRGGGISVALAGLLGIPPADRREGLGYGDFKLLAALGAWCGWQALPSIVLIAALGGIIMHCLLKPFENKNNLISFGPYIAFSGWLYLSRKFHTSSFK